MAVESQYSEYELALGEKLQVGDILITVVDTQDEEIAVLVEQLIDAVDADENLAPGNPR